MDREEWNKKVGHPMQSWEWGEFRGKRQPINRIENMLVVWTRIKYTPWLFGYIPMGKLPSYEDIKLLSNLGKKRKAIGIRMEPNVLKQDIKIDGLVIGRPLFKKKTYWWDLTKNEEELLKAMHPKGRYNIKVALKHGVEVCEDNSDEAFENYLDLMFEGTTKRQGIYSHSRNYHRQLWDSLKGEIAHLWIAELNGKILAANLIFEFKDNILHCEKIYYAYGASALEHKEVMAPTLLLWEIAKFYKYKGIKIFDLWGAEEGKGFSRFKSQFGADLVEAIGTFDLPINKPLYWVFRIAEEVRWRILRILK